MTLWEWLADNSLVSGVVVAVATGVVGGLYAVRTKIQAKAWETIYMQKRQEIMAFLANLNRFAHLVVVLGELRDVQRESYARQGGMFIYCTDQLWPRDQRRDPFVDQLLNAMPSPPGSIEAVLQPPSAADQTKFDRIRTGFTNVILSEANEINMRLSTLQATLILTIRNPNAAMHAQAVFGEYFGQLVGVGRGVDSFDFDSFPEAWAEKTAPARLALRRDLRMSAKSLAAVHRISWVWLLAGWARNPVKAFKRRWKVYVQRPD